MPFNLYQPEACNHEGFNLLLNGVISGANDRSNVESAYRFSKYGHRGQTRRTGERYFEHPKAVALILLQLQVKDAAVIIAALLHDIVEDSWILTFDDIERSYGKPSRQIIELVTVPEGMSKQAYFQLLAQAFGQPAAWLVKCADRLHNLATLDGSPAQKKWEQAEETRRYVLPRAEALTKVPQYKAQGEYFVAQLKSWCSIREFHALENSGFADN